MLGRGSACFFWLPFGRFSTFTTDLSCIVLKAYTSLLSHHQTAVSWPTVTNRKLPGSMVFSGISCTGKSFLFVLTVPTQQVLCASKSSSSRGRYRNCQQKRSVPCPGTAPSASSLLYIQGLFSQGQLQHQYKHQSLLFQLPLVPRL